MNLDFSCIFIVYILEKNPSRMCSGFKIWEKFLLLKSKYWKKLCNVLSYGIFLLFSICRRDFYLCVGVSNSDAFSIAQFRQNVCYYGFSKLLNFPGLCKNLPLQPKPVFQHFSFNMQCIISLNGSKEGVQRS